MIELRFPEAKNTTMSCAIAAYPADGGTAEDVLACLDERDATAAAVTNTSSLLSA
jgi:hypothetical protein